MKIEDYLNQEVKPLVVHLPVEKREGCQMCPDEIIEISQTYSDEPVWFKIGEYDYKIWPKQLIKILQVFISEGDVEERLEKIESFLVLK